MTPACSVIIRTLNESRYLGQVLQTIRQQDYPLSLVEIIVVDSGSTDDTVAIAQSHGAKVVHLERAQFSFGRSLNLGCEISTGQTLVFISGHCVPASTTWLWNLVQPLRRDEVVITYGRQVGGPETKFSEHALFAKYFPEHGGNGQSPFFCNNANLAVKRSCWERHRFDESLTGLEDMHLAKHAWQQGEKIIYIPEAVVYHYHHERWKQVKRRYEREAIALREIMPEVHVHWHDAMRYFSAGVLGDFGRALQQKTLLRHAGAIMAFRFCQFYGAWRGNHAHRRLSRRQKDRYFYPN
jgi:glycosyltransferase involved in cell wall biosynthesis